MRGAVSLLLAGLLMMPAPGIGAGARPDAEPAAYALDRLDVLELASRYSWAVDSGVDREALARVFTSEAVAEYVFTDADGSVSTSGRLEGFAAIHEWLRANQYRPLGSPDRPIPHHLLTSPVAEVDGEVADLRCVLHGWPGDFIGFYRIKAVKTPEGWRISRLRLESTTRDAVTEAGMSR